MRPVGSRLLTVVALLLGAAFLARAGETPLAAAEALTDKVTQGALRVIQKDGSVLECPLKHTDVEAQVSGFIARVKVTQTFYNPLDEKIEAVYVFPLPHESAVDDMTMVVGPRRIVGLIKRRAEARAIYEQALAAGQTAALLEQERPNIFTQSVGNIPPKQEVKVEISYVDVLKYDLGVYEFHFPMVVGPRYNPAGFTGGVGAVPRGEEGKSEQKTEIAYLKPGERNGHDISLGVSLNAGVPIQDLKVLNHKAEIAKDGDRKASVKLGAGDTIPNKDFVLRYAVVGQKPEMAVLCHTRAAGQGYFMLMVQPKEDEKLKASPPREIVFLMDVSGSMNGAPNAKCREAMKKALELCREQDTVQVITFANMTTKVFEKALPCTKENIEKAVNFSAQQRGSGGTEMLKGVQAAIDEPLDKERVRIVVMLTDGYIGNEAQIIEYVGKKCGDQIRFWVLGIGNSVNRFLVDGVAKQGGGMGKVLALNEDSTPVVQEMIFRIQRAQLAKAKMDWGGVDVCETFPAKLPELWAGRPLIVFGMYNSAKKATLTLSGEVEGAPAKWPIEVEFPAEAKENGVLSKVWARMKIEDLMQQTYYKGSPEVEEAVTGLALDFRLMSQYTSFVAVDEAEVAKSGEVARPPRRIQVAVPMPEGVSWEGVFGGEVEEQGVLVLRQKDDAAKDKGGLTGGFGGGRGGNARPAEALSRKLAEAGKPAADGRMIGAAPGAPPAATAAAPAPTRAAKAEQAGAAPAGAVAEGREFKKQLNAVVEKEYARRALADEEADGVTYYARFRQAQYQQAQAANRVLPSILKDAEELKAKGQFEAARAKYAFLCLLESARGQGQGGGEYGAMVHASVLEELNGELADQLAKPEPRLNKKLDLVLRDQSLPEALAAVAQQSGMAVELLPGSVEDACALLGLRELHVGYLDLRHATTVQALNWILHPLKLEWWMAQGKVVAGSLRRGGVDAPWVYDVSALAWPTQKDLQSEKDYQKQQQMVLQAAEQFLAAARQALKLKEESALWFAPGQLLVFGNGATHAAAAKLFADLASPEAAVAEELKELQKLTSQRAAGRRESGARTQTRREQFRVYEALRAYSGQLLAEAAAGKLDAEALTELSMAWKHPALAELLKGPVASTALRSLWLITESAGALPKETELAKLLETARKQARPTADEALAALEKNGDDGEAYAKVFYAALAWRTDAGYLARATPVLTAGKGQGVQPARALAAVLLGPGDEADIKTLVTLLSANLHQLRGDELVLLTALACRKAGGEVWEAFRGTQRDLLGQQGLTGSVVVLVNRLARAKLPVLAKG